MQHSPLPGRARLHDAERGGGDWVREVATGGRHCADDGDGALALGAAQAHDAAGALVEGCQPRAQVRRVAAVRRHLGQPPRNLAQRLCTRTHKADFRPFACARCLQAFSSRPKSSYSARPSI